MEAPLYRVSAVLIITLTLLLLATPLQSTAMTSSSPSQPPGTPPEEPRYVEGEILVKFRPEVSREAKDAIHRELGGRVLYEIPGIEWQVVAVPAGTEHAKVGAYRAKPSVKAAERNGYVQALWTPNDLCFDEQWGLHNPAGPGVDPGADIDAPQAWDVEKGDSALRIAIVDTGIDLDHPDLADKIVASIDCVDGTCDPGGNDDEGHGTHVAGIAAAETNNSIGGAGAAPDATLMSVKVLDSNGIGTTAAAAAGIRWAADNGGAVINMSFRVMSGGGYQYSWIVHDAVKYAWGRNQLLVGAAGNDNYQVPVYPARHPEVIAVAAHDWTGWKAGFSNWGDEVELTAPGVDIYSTHPWSGTACSYQSATNSGTSMAAPFVSGTAALAWARMAETEPCCVTNNDVRIRLITTADPVPGPPFVKYGQVNACRAVGGSGCE